MCVCVCVCVVVLVLASTSQSTDSVLLEKHGRISTRPHTHTPTHPRRCSPPSCSHSYTHPQPSLQSSSADKRRCVCVCVCVCVLKSLSLPQITIEYSNNILSNDGFQNLYGTFEGQYFLDNLQDKIRPLTIPRYKVVSMVDALIYSWWYGNSHTNYGKDLK